MNLNEALFREPLVAILRGLTPERALEVASVLLDTGFTTVEVPLNSPNAVQSIGLIRKEFTDRLVIGAGTVRTQEELNALADVGCQIALSPHCDPGLIAHSLELGIEPVPGVATPTEMMQALNAGARWLKVFPAVSCGESFFRQVRAVFPSQVRLMAVGGVAPENMRGFMQAGADAVGIGSQLFTAEKSLADIRDQAAKIIGNMRSHTTL
ncbi:bifunctional 4-hydroxy-2-oxoglutarate aldolase/2-dehydro-3-deoxy-phosphogluconate aldolase [Microbulbifer sp. ARAS458-1]|uniref:bifunctional 4-hydroxy-2-oxoglutarate aldolase/2-dehydro-3-deoxy-phosphogluconate aldolase n=1 Tax=Microbulbifer sp. ARAS458-1 TaxID=3140242 RepID=UPI0038780089